MPPSQNSLQANTDFIFIKLEISVGKAVKEPVNIFIMETPKIMVESQTPRVIDIRGILEILRLVRKENRFKNSTGFKIFQYRNSTGVL
jgi:hypothetical protein